MNSSRAKPPPPPRKRRPEDGRPSKLEVTPEITDRVCRALLDLCKHQTAAHLAGISLRTFYRMREAGAADPRGPYGDFWRAVTAAEAEAQEGLSRAAREAAKTDGRLSLDLLRARWPNVWPKEPSRVELSGRIQGQLAQMSKEDLATEAEKALAQYRSEGEG